jgi:3-phytase
MKWHLSLIAGTFLLTSCAAEQPISTNTPTNTIIIAHGDQHPYPVVADAQLSGWLFSSEQQGISWQSEQESTQLQGSFSQLDWRSLPGNNETLAIAALDNNTSAISIISLDRRTGTLTQQQQLNAGVGDTETLCLGVIDDMLQLYRVNANGTLEQFLVNTSADTWHLDLIRQLHIGPDISGCSVADKTGQIYLAEESIGIWQYDAHSEGENRRTLHATPKSLEIKSISATADGQVYFSSPDASALWQLNPLNKVVTLDANSAPEQMSVASAGTQLYLGWWDENNEQASSAVIPFVPSTTTIAAPADDSFIASQETTPVGRYGDAADDPAIWVNKAKPAQSLILGTDKKAGLNVYNLQGQRLQFLPVGRVNNVDIRYGVNINGKTMDIAVASNRTTQSLSIFAIQPTSGWVSFIADLPTTLTDIYGLCLYQDRQHNIHAFANDTLGNYQQYQLHLSDPSLHAELVDTFTTPSQPEGCVADDNNAMLYYGEESAGVWSRSLLKTSPATAMLITTPSNKIEPDIEGIGLYQLNNQRYLIVSSQGNNRYGVYQLPDASKEASSTHRQAKLLGTFSIGINPIAGIDGVSETDGLEVTHLSLGPDFPEGLIVVQDGRNVLPSAPQNFKLISASLLREFILARTPG